jgi:hypothetical protein
MANLMIVKKTLLAPAQGEAPDTTLPREQYTPCHGITRIRL